MYYIDKVFYSVLYKKIFSEIITFLVRAVLLLTIQHFNFKITSKGT